MNNLEETIVLLDNSIKIVFVNKSGEELFQKGAYDIIGKRLSHILHGRNSLTRYVKKTLSEGRSFKGRSEPINIGRDINIDFSLAPFFLNGKIHGALLSMTQNIYFPEREDYDFESSVYLLAAVAHEIKNPLGGIKGAAQLLRKMTQGEHNDEYLDLIIRETDRLDAILQDYLTVCKKPVIDIVNIHEIMEKALSVLQVPIQKAGITLRRLYDPSLPAVMGDGGKLLQVFLNIIKNAIESTKKGGGLEISTYPSDELIGEHGRSKRMAVISISDTGKGISEKDIKKIFIPFYTKKKKGLGIGLALTKKIIKDHRGFIKVTSKRNQGTCFHIYLPFEYNG